MKIATAIRFLVAAAAWIAPAVSHIAALSPQRLSRNASHGNPNAQGKGENGASAVGPVSKWAPPQPADNTLWNYCKCKGEKLWRATYMSDRDAGQLFSHGVTSAASRFRNIEDLDIWGYSTGDLGGWQIKFDVTWGVAHVLRDLGFSDKCSAEDGYLECFRVVHGDEHADLDGQTYVANGRTLRATGAFFSFAFDPEDGIFIFMEKLTAKYAARQRHPPVLGNALPALQQSSDVAWLFYKYVADQQENDVRNLKNFLVVSISNTNTLRIIRRVLDQRGTTLGPWPGLEIAINSDEGHALLGSPNGNALGYMLVQHKAELGHFGVSKVRMFYGGTPVHRPCLLFYVGRLT
ncbi:hypothetical protein CC78DRAFT_88846 [Lojkania enalia]|uniref:Uncharacterized protein n=1 Tax=Lojkania enalia TaxID=147567 RepID=A0A9P4JXU3_9PLEO|nr:hypothetical protein CC78DRAFT_88846 [Didymosphaeria enalia]